MFNSILDVQIENYNYFNNILEFLLFFFIELFYLYFEFILCKLQTFKSTMFVIKTVSFIYSPT